VTVTLDNSQTVTGTVNVTVVAVSLGGNTLLEASTADSSASSAAYVAVGVVIGVAVLALLVVVAIVRRRKQALKTSIANEPFHNTVGGSGAATGSLDNPMYLQGCGVAGIPGDFDNGVQNPMYAWYRPDMSRQESEEFLLDQVEGAFVIRDSTATPGWHMLAVKTHSAIVHEKIKMTDDGLYELLPNAASRSQPRFSAVPELVEHYSHPQDGIRYALALDNPLYDNGQMAQKKHGHAVSGAWSYQKDAAAPSLPLKEREKEVMQQIVQSEGDEIYTNQEQAKTAISSA